MDLFRKQVIEQQGNRLYGDVTLTTPLATWIITALIGTIIAGVLTVLVFGNYARKETVTGWLTPDKGLVKIISPQQGTVEKVYIGEGDFVKQGDPLVSLDLDTAFIGGDGVVETALNELIAQLSEREKLIGLTEQRFEQEENALNDRIKASRIETKRLQKQYNILNTRIEGAREILSRYESLAEEDAASFIEVERQRENVLALEQSAMQIQQQIDFKRAETINHQNRLVSLPLEQSTAIAELREVIAQLKAQKAQLSRQGNMVMTAPVSGRIAALPITVGQAIQTQQLAITILPEGGNLEAELFVPTRAVGFVQKGQNVRLQFDAFPSQKFGVTEGEVISASKTIFEPRELPITIGLAEPVYRIRVSLNAQNISAYGEKFPLQSGMTLRADIIQEKRKLWEVLLEPLLSRV